MIQLPVNVEGCELTWPGRICTQNIHDNFSPHHLCRNDKQEPTKVKEELTSRTEALKGKPSFQTSLSLLTVIHMSTFILMTR